MRIAVVAMARNEDDVIEAFVRWHARYADRLFVIDHASRDRTGEILEALRGEGLPLEVEHVERPELSQSRVTTELAVRAARALAADWVLPFDADEFLGAEGGGSPRAAIEKLEPGVIHRVLWRSYVPRPEDAERAGPVLERIRERRAAEPVAHHKLLVPGALLRRRGVSLTSGNHRVRRRRWLRERTVASRLAPELWLAHLPVRSVEQLRTKAVVGWLARLASPEQRREPRKNLHLRRLFEIVRGGSDLRGADVTRFAFGYPAMGEAREDPLELVSDPLLGPGESLDLRYTPERRIPTLAAVADLAERLALRVGGHGGREGAGGAGGAG